MLICVAVAGYLVSDLIDSGKASAARASSNPAAAMVQSQRLIDGRLAVHAAGRGNPWLNLQDGRELTTVYKGSNEARALIESSAQPRTLATADFDEDGVKDLLVGYASAGAGVLSFYRGNIDAFAPQTQESWEGISQMHLPERL